ncbi:MAG: TetR/AcrR family transcriptional regulator [Promethearchaeia archaeon]
MPSKREKRNKRIRKKKKELYLMSAVKVFEKQGFHDTRVKDITNIADTSVGNFYRYFESKESIFEELISQLYKLMMKKLKTLDNHQVPPIDAIRNLFRSYMEMFKEKKQIFLIYIEQMAGISKRYSDLKTEYQQNFTNEVEKIIKRVVDSGLGRKQNTRLTARLWVSCILDAFHWWIRLSDLEEDEFIDNLVNFLVSATMK